MNVLGVKPLPQGDDLQLFIQIPNSQYAIRIWSGGLHQLRHYCFDFYDVASGVLVNTQRASSPGMFSTPARIPMAGR